MEILFIVVVYILGACFTSGYRGGVRDEMEGIGDIFCIIFWPLVLAALFIYEVPKFIYAVGKQVGGKK